jgi:hypothetical protein
MPHGWCGTVLTRLSAHVDPAGCEVFRYQHGIHVFVTVMDCSKAICMPRIGKARGEKCEVVSEGFIEIYLFVYQQISKEACQ